MAEKESRSRNRSSNFSMDEKICLFTIIGEYKGTLENKKTDAVINQDKIKTWEKVIKEFNCLSPGNIQGPVDVLKRFYENQKKELRKKCANRKMNVKGTGGGPPLPDKENNCSEDLLLSIINKKTVYGMDPPFGGDVDSDSEDEDKIQNKADRVTATINNQIEFLYDESSEPNSSILHDMEEDTPEIESNFIQPSTSTELLQDNIQKRKTWASYKPSDLEGQMSSPLKKKIKTVQSNSQKEPIPGPSTIEKETPKRSSRRRPAVVVKALTSSDIATKYDKLLDGRLEIVEFAKKEFEQKLEQNTNKHNKEMILLDLQIEIEKEKLKKLSNLNIM